MIFSAQVRAECVVSSQKSVKEGRMLGEEGGKQRELCFMAVPLFLPLLTAGAAPLPHSPLERTPNSFILLSSSISLLEMGKEERKEGKKGGREGGLSSYRSMSRTLPQDYL